MNTVEGVAGAKSAVSATFPVLADPDHQVADTYGVYNLLGDGLAAPAVFVIADDGSVVWSYIGQSATDRPTAADVLAQLP